MEYTKVLAVGVVVLLAAGGVAATGGGIGTQSTTAGTSNVDAHAAYENGTVTVVVTDSGVALENVSVSVDDERVGTTGVNGTVVFETNATEELEIELVGGDFEGELSYVIENGSLTLVEESYEYERVVEDDREDTDSEEKGEGDAEESESEERDSDSDDEDETSEDEASEGESEDEESDDDDEAEGTAGEE